MYVGGNLKLFSNGLFMSLIHDIDEILPPY